MQLPWTETEPEFGGPLLDLMRRQAAQIGLAPAKVTNRYTVRLRLE